MSQGCSSYNFQTGACTNANKDFDFLVTFSVTDVNKDPVPLTGDVFQLVIKDDLNGAVLLTLDHVVDNVSTGIYIPSPTTGVISIQITDTDVATVPAGVYPYQMAKTDSDGKITVFAQGTFQFYNRGF